MEFSPTPLPVPRHLLRGAHRTHKEWLQSGRFAVRLLCRAVGRENLDAVEVLDVGCGTKIVKTLLDNELPIGHYAGIDVSAEVVEWLDANVSDPRFEFHHIDAHNEMYNPGGKPLESFSLLPVGPREFDLICLFSVFTHLAPHDYVAMLRLLRRHVRPDGRLLFSLFLDDPEHPSPYKLAIERMLRSDDPEVRARAEAAATAARERDTRFVDEVPDNPLERARYEKDYALELVDDTGWEVLAVRPPQRYIQHYMVCRPS
jgi:SAM-dependent methyltransferase